MSRQESFNLRSSIEGAQVDYLAALRDGALLDTFGLPVEIKVPKIENNLDEYINFVDDDFYISRTVVVPNFDEYRTVLSQLGQTAEENYPLEVIIPSALHLPRNSRIVLSEYDANENKTSREWRVLSTEIKQLSNSKTYSRIAYCVPARSTVQNTANVNPVCCYVETSDVKGYVIWDDLNAFSSNQGKAFVIPNFSKGNVKSSAEATCRVYYNVKLPSILY